MCVVSKSIFAGPSKVFTQANKDQLRESNHAVYSLYNSDILGNSNNCGVGEGVRSESNGKMRTSPLIEFIKEEILPLLPLSRPGCRPK